MIADLFSAGFAWDDVAPVATPVATRPCEYAGTRPAAASQSGATGNATASAQAFSGDFGWNDDDVANVANVAEPDGQARAVAVSQPSHATDDATQEIAVFCASESEFLGSVAPVASVANWSSAIEAIRGTTAPDGIRASDWRRLIADARALVTNWGEDLVKAGWSTVDVFGVELDQRARRLDRVGLCRFLKGASVEAIDADTALIRVTAADTHTFDRRLLAAGGVPFWVWAGGRLDGLPARQPGEGYGERANALPHPPRSRQQAEEIR
ncbi:hypothetical protein M9978_16575 [Sphingomonas sp. MG17]|uniref:Uncharacterized protein n=1 Tax=Sphingomonas tagetis TaxID=2949092 RepID=A0A9X2KN04_9SPHN|nr:hypothetical protein [Sphingomonas tagetis]MCP3732041.1 hypothetical protein [Sphingomonas tagetis]